VKKDIDKKIYHAKRILRMIFATSKLGETLGHGLFKNNDGLHQLIVQTSKDVDMTFLKYDYAAIYHYIKNNYKNLIYITGTDEYDNYITVNFGSAVYSFPEKFPNFKFHDTIDMTDEEFELWFRLNY
jgi:hypothetical protein